MRKVDPIRCPVCNSVKNRAGGLIRLSNGELAERRHCENCGETWAVDDDGYEVSSELVNGRL